MNEKLSREEGDKIERDMLNYDGKNTNQTYLVNEIDDSVINSTIDFKTLLQHLSIIQSQRR